MDSKKQIENNKKENKRENEENRKLQLNILKYQQEMQWLNMFRQASIEYVSAYTYNDLVHSINVMRENPKDAFKILGHLLERLAKCDTNLAYVGVRGKNMEKLYNTCASFFILYNDVIDVVLLQYDRSVLSIINREGNRFMGNYIRVVITNQGNTQGGVHSRILMSERISGNTRSLRLAISTAEHNPYFVCF